jgi:hypothetical protein
LTSWTCEGGQGGWFYDAMRSPELTNVTFVPQAYDGNMTRWDSHGIVEDLENWGVDPARIMPFYDSPELRTAYVSYRAFFYFEHRMYP